MRKWAARRIVTVALFLITFTLLASMQPVFFGVQTYFGINPLIILLPISFICIILMCLHLYQNWPIMLSWFKKSPDKNKQKDKIQRMVILIAFILILGYDISSAWYYALKVGIAGAPIETIRLWSWVATLLLIIHVWQRWKLTFSYFRWRSKKKPEQ
jgi:hypothetical protein